MKTSLLLLFLFIGISGFSQTKENLQNASWNGYTQLRAVSNFNDYSTAMVRRLKLWVRSSPEFSKHWSYKLQTTLSSLHQENFFLQDVKVSYKSGLFSFNFGQFTPQYSLQRFQSDYSMGIIERSIVVNTLIPNGTMGARDIGLQANFHTKNKLIVSHIGVFNGYGIKKYEFNNQGYLLTHKTAINIPLAKNKLQIGYSLMYREASNLKIKRVLPDTVSYSGSDIRYNLFALYRAHSWELQGEYLNANLEGRIANGYYILATVNIKKSQLIASFENYKNTYEASKGPYYHLGYVYLIKKNKVKLYFDNSFQIDGGINNYYASVQLQVFLK